MRNLRDRPPHPCTKRSRRAANPKPQPPSAAQAAHISSEAWKEPVWDLFVWLAMTTAARKRRVAGRVAVPGQVGDPARR